MNPESAETYINHPTWGLLYRICMVDEAQDLFTTLYAQRLFFLVVNDMKALKFQPIGRTEARMLLEIVCGLCVAMVNHRSTISFRVFSNAHSND